MSLAERVPLMKPGSTVRNVVVALGYLFFWWLAVLALPFIAAYKVYTGDWSEKLSKLPGIEPGGGAVPALAAFAYVFVALGVVGAVAGGGGGDAPESSSASLDGTPTADARATASATQANQNQDQDQGGDNDATATAKPTDSPEPTASPTPSEPTHAVGETFTVGSGEKTVEYTVVSVETASNVGGEYGEDADAQFVVVELKVTNKASESFTVSSNMFTLVDDQGREYDVDTDAMVYADDPIIYEQVDPGVTKTGIVIFDVPEDQQTRQLKIKPAGMFSTARDHLVILKE